MTEDTRVIEATETQIKKLTKLYHAGLASDKRFIPIDKLSVEEWLILRSIAGIGSSEISTVLGKNPAYFIGTPLKAWKEKTGHVIEVTDTPRLRIGRNVEDTIRKEYEYLTGRKVMSVKDKMFIHPEIDFLFSNLDGVIEPVSGDNWGVLECKATTSYVYESWIAKLPPYYFRQSMGELSVANNHPVFKNAVFDYVDFAILLLDRWEVVVLRIKEDKEFILAQEKEVTEWYNNYVKENVPPPESVAEWAKTEPLADSFTEITSQTYAVYEDLVKIKKQVSEMEERKTELEELLKAEFKDNETLIYQGEPIATWKAQPKTSVDSKKLKTEEPDIYQKYSKTTLSRILRLKELKVMEY